MAFAEIEISRGVLPRICRLSRLESCSYNDPVFLSLARSLSLSPLSLSCRRLRFLLSDRREPRDTNLSFELSLPFPLASSLLPVAFAHCLIFSLCDGRATLFISREFVEPLNTQRPPGEIPFKLRPNSETRRTKNRRSRCRPLARSKHLLGKFSRCA